MNFLTHPLVVFVAGIVVGVIFDAKIRGAATAATSRLGGAA